LTPPSSPPPGTGAQRASWVIWLQPGLWRLHGRHSTASRGKGAQHTRREKWQRSPCDGAPAPTPQPAPQATTSARVVTRFVALWYVASLLETKPTQITWRNSEEAPAPRHTKGAGAQRRAAGYI